ncbi:MAG: glycoside hydrolase family 3 C-terminal domain-containing protein [Firmicutes bacterium]|nr:glycoside hydrolase family 3 C-terminal domain-containing protein [Bacillota bacterium]
MEKEYPGTMSVEITEREKRHCAIARRAAAEGMVLLKNDGVLPLASNAAVTLYGGGASYTVKGGTGSGMVNNRTNVSITEGLRDAGVQLLNEDWLASYDQAYEEARNAWIQKIYDIAGAPGDFGKLYAAHASNPMVMPKGDPIEKKETDTAIFVISRISGEGADRRAVPGDYYLSEDETETLRQITALYPKTIIVLNVGGIIDLSFLDEFPIAAVVLMSQAGMEGGHALADVLTGAVAPSGRLSDTWAYNYYDYPSSEKFSHNNGNVVEEKYTEGIYVGYRYFDTFAVEPRFPFGYGLSYTTFRLLRSETHVDGDRVYVTADVQNTGETAGKQVLMLFADLPEGTRPKERRRLVAFAKTDLLEPGAEETLELSFPLYLLASYHTATSTYYMERGWYVLTLDSCDASGVMEKQTVGTLALTEDRKLDTLSPICPLLDALKEIRPDSMPERPAFSELINIDAAVTMAAANITLQHIKDDIAKLPYAFEVDEILDQMSREQKARLVCGQPSVMSGEIIGSAAMTIPGAAGETTHCLEGLGVGHLILADGPAGIRLQKHYQVDPETGEIYKMNRYETLENRIFGKEFLKEDAEDHYQFCSAIPVGTLLAQSFDVKLMQEIGDLIGTEMEEMGVQVWLAPGMNIHRNPLCGRNFEYYSEDPVVSGMMAAAITRGVELHPGCAVTIKHYACNNQEENRRGVSSIVSERALREIYLKGFEIAVKEAHPKAIMTSYNKVNGVHTANSYDLCTTAARKEWGFNGIIMTDWLTTNSDGGSAAAKCISAGNDLIMPGNQSDVQEILDALDAKYDLTLSKDDLNACCRRMLSMILRLTRE